MTDIPFATSILTTGIVELERAADLLGEYATRFYPQVDQNFVSEMQAALRGRADYLRAREGLAR